MKKNQVSYFFLIVVICICIMVVKLIIPGWVQTYYSHIELKNALPKCGSYHCKDLESSISFDGDILYYYSNNTPEQLLLPVGNSPDFYGISGDISGTYYWNQEKDTLEISFSRYPHDFEKEETYIFMRKIP